MASTGCGLSFRLFGTRPLRLISAARSMMARSVLLSSASISRKCLGGLRDMAVRAVREDFRLSVGEHVTLERDARVIEGSRGEFDLRLADDQRRQEAHDIIA